MASPTQGCLVTAAPGRTAPVSRAGKKSRKPRRRKRTKPSTLRKIRPCRAPTFSCVKRRQIDLQQVRHQADDHVAVDARAGVLDQVAADDLQRLAQQVGRGDQAEEEGGRPVHDLAAQAGFRPRLDAIDQLAEQHGDGGVGGAGEGHQQRRRAQRDAVAQTGSASTPAGRAAGSAQLAPQTRGVVVHGSCSFSLRGGAHQPEARPRAVPRSRFGLVLKDRSTAAAGTRSRHHVADGERLGLQEGGELALDHLAGVTRPEGRRPAPPQSGTRCAAPPRRLSCVPGCGTKLGVPYLSSRERTSVSNVRSRGHPESEPGEPVLANRESNAQCREHPFITGGTHDSTQKTAPQTIVSGRVSVAGAAGVHYVGRPVAAQSAGDCPNRTRETDGRRSLPHPLDGSRGAAGTLLGAHRRQLPRPAGPAAPTGRPSCARCRAGTGLPPRALPRPAVRRRRARCVAPSAAGSSTRSSTPTRIVDFLLSIGMRPFVELSFMPAALASGGDTIFPTGAT